MPSKALASVIRAAGKAVVAAEARDEAIREAHSQGETIRAIASAANLSSARIHQIIHRR